MLPATIQDNIKERIKIIIGELIPEETYNQIVTASISEFIKEDMPKFVKEELTKKYKELIHLYFIQPEWQSMWDRDGKEIASEAVKEIIIEAAPKILASMIGSISQQILMNIRSQIDSYPRY